MTTRNLTSYLPNLLGPLDLQADGIEADVPRRSTINIVGGSIEDDSTNERTNIVLGSPLSTTNSVMDQTGEQIDTTNATPTTIGATFALPTDSITTVDAQVSCIQAGATKAKIFNVRRHLLNNDETITASAQVNMSGPDEIGGAMLASVAITYTGTTGRIEVTGVASTDLRWRVDRQSVRVTAAEAPPVTPFDPATLTLTGWWRGSYSASPWVGSASAGASGTRNLTEATNPPASGAAVNGFTPADFDGTNDILNSTATFADFFGTGTTAYSIWLLVKPDTLAADNTYTSEPHLLSDAGGNWAISIATSGVRLTSWDSGPASATTGYAAISAGAWSLVQARWTGTQIQIRVNGGAWQSAAITSFWAVVETLTMIMGKSGATANFYDGQILDCGIDNSSLSDADFDDVRSYILDRYGLTV